MYPTLFATPGLKAFAEQLDAERQAQLTKWGDQRHPDGTGPDARFLGMPILAFLADVRRAVDTANAAGAAEWLGILLEEVFEAAVETDPVKLRAELRQIAAVCQAWDSDLERRGHSALEERTVTAESIAEIFQWIPTEQLHIAGCSTVRLTLLANGERQAAQLGDTIVRDSRGGFTVRRAEEQPFTPPVHYVRDDGAQCCVHTIPVGPDSCRHCRELAEAER
jgi:hypothetical protein